MNRIKLVCDESARTIKYYFWEQNGQWVKIGDDIFPSSLEPYTETTIKKHGEEIAGCIKNVYGAGQCVELVFEKNDANFVLMEYIVNKKYGSDNGIRCVCEAGEEAPAQPEAHLPETVPEPEDVPEEYGEIVISSILQIGKGERKRYRNKTVCFRSLVNCEGELVFENCTIRYGEIPGADKITLGKEASLTMTHCTLEDNNDEKYCFIEARGCEKTLEFSDCKFVNCGYFLSLGGRGSCVLDRCLVIDPKAHFVDGSGDVTVSHSRIEFEHLYCNQEAYSSIFSCRDFHLSDVTVAGNAREFNAMDTDVHKIYKGNTYFCHAPHTVIERSSFSNLAYICEYKAECRLSVFENCAIIFQSASVEDCRFDGCGEIVTGADAGNKLRNCQFNRCRRNLLKTCFGGSAVIISFCEFNDWNSQDKADMLVFSKYKHQSDSSVKSCVFNGIDTGTQFLVSGRVVEKIPGYVAVVDDCSFINCRSAGPFINEDGYYYPTFSHKRRTIQAVEARVDDNRGLDKVNEGSSDPNPYDLKTRASDGTPLGADTEELQEAGAKH